ncbi:hypothetical protein HDU99_005694, partial [Rhizoclosmatium hyalinum]
MASLKAVQKATKAKNRLYEGLDEAVQEVKKGRKKTKPKIRGTSTLTAASAAAKEKEEKVYTFIVKKGQRVEEKGVKRLNLEEGIFESVSLRGGFDYDRVIEAVLKKMYPKELIMDTERFGLVHVEGPINVDESMKVMNWPNIHMQSNKYRVLALVAVSGERLVDSTDSTPAPSPDKTIKKTCAKLKTLTLSPRKRKRAVVSDSSTDDDVRDEFVSHAYMSDNDEVECTGSTPSMTASAPHFIASSSSIGDSLSVSSCGSLDADEAYVSKDQAPKVPLVRNVIAPPSNVSLSSLIEKTRKVHQAPIRVLSSSGNSVRTIEIHDEDFILDNIKITEPEREGSEKFAWLNVRLNVGCDGELWALKCFKENNDDTEEKARMELHSNHLGAQVANELNKKATAAYLALNQTPKTLAMFTRMMVIVLNGCKSEKLKGMEAFRKYWIAEE